MKNTYEAVKQYLLTSPLFDAIQISDGRLIVTRIRSRIPKRGIFRPLIPRIHVVVTAGQDQALKISLRPDPFTVFMVIMFLAGVTSEFFVDRLLYPRDYPPEFIYGLAICYIGFLVVEIFNTQKLIRTLYSQIET